jgi:hypothetical protein
MGRRLLGAETQRFLEDSGSQYRWKVNYVIDRSARLVVTVAEGRVVFDDIRDHQNRLLADPDFEITFDQLIDTSPAQEVDITQDEARVLAQRRIVSSESRRAFVAVKPHIFGLGRMMEIYHTDLGYAKVRVTDSMQEALNWLGVSSSKATHR